MTDREDRRALAMLRRFVGRSPAVPPPTPTNESFEKTTSAVDRAIVERARPYTLTSGPRLQSVIDAVRYLEARGIPGAFAECGVWRGGSILAMLLTLQDVGVVNRDVYLYDTFEGMTEPTEMDTSPFEVSASDTWNEATQAGARAYGYYFAEETYNEQQVRQLLTESGYPDDRLHIVRGRVEDTVPVQAPGQLALLRLDTDWYESTRHELEHLYDRLSPGGVLIIDDYGHWDGARRAVEEFFSARPPLLLSRIDYTGRMAVKA